MTDQPYNHFPPELSESDLEQLSAYIDDQLTPEERAALESRLREDAFLRAELEDLRRAVALIRTLSPLQAPRDFVLSAADVAGIEQEEPSQRILRPAFRTSWVAGLAAAIVVVVVGILIVVPNLPGSADSAPEALSVADQPTEIVDQTFDGAAEEAADSPPGESEARMIPSATPQPSLIAETQASFSPTMTVLQAIQPTALPTQPATLLAQPTFGVPSVGLTATSVYSTVSVEQLTTVAEEDALPEAEIQEETTGGASSNAVAASPLPESDAADADSTDAMDDAEEGAVLGGIAADEAVEAEEVPEAQPETQMEMAEEGSSGALFIEPDSASSEADAEALLTEPQLGTESSQMLQMPTPQMLLQTALRWLIVLLQMVFGA